MELYENKAFAKKKFRLFSILIKSKHSTIERERDFKLHWRLTYRKMIFYFDDIQTEHPITGIVPEFEAITFMCRTNKILVVSLDI